MNSLPETFHFLQTVVLKVTSDINTAVLNRSALTAQERQTTSGRGGGREDMEG